VKIRTDQITNRILVTGVIRSGTTILGKVLSFPIEVDYLHEPFHGCYTLGDRHALLPRYVRPEDRSEDAQSYRARIARLYDYDIGAWTTYYDGDSWYRKAAKHLVGSRRPFFLRLAKTNPFHRAVLIKDPFGKMVAELLYREFDTTPVIMIRHPVSLAASLRRLGWWPELREFRVQPDLIEDYFSDEPDFLTRSWPNRMLESMAHWRATYKMLLSQANKYDDWPIVTHETFCERPVEVTRRLYEHLELPWSDRYADKIRSLTSSSNSTGARGGHVQDFQRDTSSLFEMRRDSVPTGERRQIFNVVKDVALDIYSRDSFALD